MEVCMLPMTTNFARHGKRKWFNRLYEQPLITSATWLTAHIAPLQGAEGFRLPLFYQCPRASLATVNENAFIVFMSNL